MRDPEAPGWPERGERTEIEEIAKRWKWAYLALARGEHRRRVLGLGRVPERLDAAVRGFLEHRERAVERATFINDRSATGHLLDHFRGHVLTSTVAEPAALQALVDELLAAGYQPTTLDTYTRSWRVFFEWCHFGVCGQALRQGSTNRRRLAEFFDPVGELRLPDPGATDVGTLPDEALPELFRAAERVDAQRRRGHPSAVLACGVGLYMGARQGEIFALAWQEISKPSRTVRFNFQVQKDRAELKPLKGKLARTALVLPEWWELHRPAVGFVVGRAGRPMGTTAQRDMITRVLDASGLNGPGIGWHVLRHTFARLFLERGGRMGELQKSLGHSSIRTTEQTYGHFQEDVAAKLARERIYGA